jgi:GTP pyrophosphokinase
VVTIRHELQSGDQVEVMTQTNQKPKQEWLQIVKTSRAKSKIRLALKETQQADGLFAKEALERKFRNRKIEIDEPVMMHVIRRMGFKETSEFYRQIADGRLDVNDVADRYLEEKQRQQLPTGDNPTRSAAEFQFEPTPNTQQPAAKENDVLVIDEHLKGIDFQLAHCCHPIYGDPVFGFLTAGGGVKIHRQDCPNAPELRKRFGYRIVRACWDGKGASKYTITLRVVGNDDIGIVNNLTSIISKDERLTLRSINIDSDDGLFRGNLVVMLDDTSRLETLIKKLRTVKGVKQVERI